MVGSDGVQACPSTCGYNLLALAGLLRRGKGKSSAFTVATAKHLSQTNLAVDGRHPAVSWSRAAQEEERIPRLIWRYPEKNGE
jgi:hypothetical protein